MAAVGLPKVWLAPASVQEATPFQVEEVIGWEAEVVDAGGASSSLHWGRRASWQRGLPGL